MKRILSGKIFKDISYNLIQTIVVQITGIITFFITSRYLIKSEYGELNWIFAIGTTITTIACLGLDMTLIKSISEKKYSEKRLFQIHYFHTLISSLLLFGLGFVFFKLYPDFEKVHPLFLLVFSASLFIYLANSYRLTLTGLRKFKKVAFISICGNLIKALGIPLLLLFNVLSVGTVAYIWLVSSLIEFLAAIYSGAFRDDLGWLPKWHKDQYKELLVVSFPVFLAVIFDSVLAKIDWILMGFFSTQTLTADYIFAYKVFELSKLPLLVIAPLFLPYLTRLFGEKSISDEKKKKFLSLIKLMMSIAVIIPLVLDICWKEFFNIVTAGKYGYSNFWIFFILSLCVPLHYLINFMYSKSYALGKLKTIMWSTMVVSIINLILNCILIPKLGGIGAAFSFLIATILQGLIYIIKTQNEGVPTNVLLFLQPIVMGALSMCISKMTTNVYIAVVLALTTYLCLCFSTGYINIRYWINQLKK